MDTMDALKARRMTLRTSAEPPRVAWDEPQPCAWCWALTGDETWDEAALAPGVDGVLCDDCGVLAWELLDRQAFAEVLRDFYQQDGAALQLLRQRFPDLAQDYELGEAPTQENPFLTL